MDHDSALKGAVRNVKGIYPTSREMLAQALNLAHHAVALDTANEVQAALQAYEDAVAILDGLMVKAKDRERVKLTSIASTYEERIRLLTSLGARSASDDTVPEASPRMVEKLQPNTAKALTEQASRVQAEHDESFGSLKTQPSSSNSARLRTISGHEVEAVHISPLLLPRKELPARDDLAQSTHIKPQHKSEIMAHRTALPMLPRKEGPNLHDRSVMARNVDQSSEIHHSRSTAIEPQTRLGEDDGHLLQHKVHARTVGRDDRGQASAIAPLVSQKVPVQNDSANSRTTEMPGPMSKAASTADPKRKVDLVYRILLLIAASIKPSPEAQSTSAGKHRKSSLEGAALRQGIFIPQRLWRSAETIASMPGKTQIIDQKAKACETAALALNDLHLALQVPAARGSKGDDLPLLGSESLNRAEPQELIENFRLALAQAQIQLPKKSEIRKVSASLHSTPQQSFFFGSASPRSIDHGFSAESDLDISWARYVRAIHDMATKAQIIPHLRLFAEDGKHQGWQPIIREADAFFAVHVSSCILRDVQVLTELQLRQGFLKYSS